MTARLPKVAWLAGRLIILSLMGGIAVMLAAGSTTALKLFWGLAVPLLPGILVIVPGAWRQVCPMAFMNQLPRELGISRNYTLPQPVQRLSFVIAASLFLAAIGLRAPLLNSNGAVLAAGLVAMLLLALLGGFFFKGRSGWCGTFCPLGPIQREYGHAPLIIARNGYCETCVGCQKNCYDFNPRAAVFADIHDGDHRHSEQRQLFVALSPGLILGYFLQSSIPQIPSNFDMLVIAVFVLASAGSYQFARHILGITPFRAYNAYAAIGILTFYWFAAPIIINTISQLINVVPSADLLTASRYTGFALSAIILAMGRRSEVHYESEKSQDIVIAIDQSKRPQVARGALSPLTATEISSGYTFPVAPAQTLLSAMETARVKINSGCRSGLCGADAVEVCGGAENLAPASEDELATLQRIGAGSSTRLACMCIPHGPIVIDTKRRKGDRGVPRTNRVDDPAKALGIRRVVIIGNGPAGIAAAEVLRNHSLSVEISVVTDENYHHYNRMALGKLISGTVKVDDLYLLPDSWYFEQRVEMRKGIKISYIDRAEQLVVTSDGDKLPYDRLVIATGASARIPGPSFANLENAFVIRRADDAQAIFQRAQSHRISHVTVMGGGVLGVEAAEAIRKLGCTVTIIDNVGRLLSRQIDEKGSHILASYLQNMGIALCLGTSVQQLVGTPVVTEVILENGQSFATDLVVACLGVSANTELAVDCGLKVGRGILVSNQMQTSDKKIYAVGDVAEIKGEVSGLWSIAAQQGATAAATMLEQPTKTPKRRTVLELKSDGIDLRSFGTLSVANGVEVINSPPGDQIWWKLVSTNDELSGAAFVGPPGSAREFTHALVNGASIAELQELLSGRNPAI